MLHRKVMFSALRPPDLRRVREVPAVLEVDTRSLINAHRERLWLCPINSGNTRRKASLRGAMSFARIGDYRYGHWRRRRPPGERVVELAVDAAVPDISDHVRRVVVMRGRDIIEVIDERRAARVIVVGRCPERKPRGDLTRSGVEMPA